MSNDDSIDFTSSHPINWPALFTVEALMMLVIGFNLWVGDYRVATFLVLIGAAIGFGIYGRVREEQGTSAAWTGKAALGTGALALILSLVEIVRAWSAHGG